MSARDARNHGGSFRLAPSVTRVVGFSVSLARVSLDGSRIKEKRDCKQLNCPALTTLYFIFVFHSLFYTIKSVEVWNSLSKQGLSRFFPGPVRNSGYSLLSSHTWV